MTVDNRFMLFIAVYMYSSRTVIYCATFHGLLLSIYEKTVVFHSRPYRKLCFNLRMYMFRKKTVLQKKTTKKKNEF